MPAEEHGSLNRLYRDLDGWQATHNYTLRDMQPLREHLRQIDTDDDTVNRVLHGRPSLDRVNAT